MEMPAVFAHSPYTDATIAADQPSDSKAVAEKESSGFDWFFATGVLMFVGLAATLVLVVV
jgi:hypothetical protein